MNLEYTEEYERYREEVRSFLTGWPLSGTEAALPEGEQEALFRRRGIEAGFVCRNVPAEYGGAGQEPDALKDAIVRDEFYAAGAPGDLVSQGAGMLV
ncbi:MAG: acyl-CoA dehydrogenase family protein, partial [Myxococcota bacterium]|nr:acyl-CoA dehydrogenase family protein [Myxococcota bacterium]